ncbi:hypothetical protein ABH931_006425 [Streptacidiphilus sp. MAP12-33]|uniref:damage-control phosphatase ARMT1 family protein n=1 Tax=Streptacidiphilus sp. MAP12-33 TaxID=3156266 RepID=UPI003516C514
MTHRPPVIVSSESPFATDVFVTRHPALVERLLTAWSFGPEQEHRLRELAEESAHGVIRPLPTGAHGAELWDGWGREYFGRPWTEAPFLWAESFFYRRLLDAAGYFDAGAWRQVDVFAPFKEAELAGESVSATLSALDGLADLDEDARGRALLLASLWGNRADLGFQLTAGRPQEASGLVADESERLWEVLRGSPGGTVAVVADNAGAELVADLVLIDHLLATGLAGDVVLHVKPAPYYVSDATSADVRLCRYRLRTAGPAARAVEARLREASTAGRLRVGTDAFFCAPFDYTALPERLRTPFAAASVTVMKGDLNYRRLVGDRWWEPTVPFAEATDYFPGPVAALRTLKSDVVVGLAPEVPDRLDASVPGWRTAGTHGLLQLAGAPWSRSRHRLL